MGNSMLEESRHY